MNQRWYHVPPQSRSADAPGGSTELQCVDESGVRRCRHRVAGCCSAQTDAPARAPLQSCVFCGRHFFYIGSRWLLADAGRRPPAAGRRVYRVTGVMCYNIYIVCVIMCGCAWVCAAGVWQWQCSSSSSSSSSSQGPKAGARGRGAGGGGQAGPHVAKAPLPSDV